MSEVDFAFAWEGALEAIGPWAHLQVVELRGTEALSRPYRYEIILFAREPAPDIDPEELIQARATLRIVTGAEPPVRLVHGIVAEAEELGSVQDGTLYRVVLVPPLARAAYRTRCRVFLEKTTRQIIDAVLQGDPQLRRDDGATAPAADVEHVFSPARELFAWRVVDTSRVDQVAARPYCVQYNESDLAFVARLLEEEGIAYHFEHGHGVCLLVLSDSDAGRTRLDPFAPLGPNIAGRAVTGMKLGARLRPRKVSLADYNWKNPALDMAVAAPARPGAAELVDHAYPGRYPDTPDQGRPLAAARLDRLGVEASYGVGEGPCRVLAAGSIFALESLKPRHAGEYLVTQLDVRARQEGVLAPSARSALLQNATLDGPYTATFECARRGKEGAVAESRFRPARVTPKPGIHGTQTAFVTAEPDAQGAEINVGGPPGAEIGCVRVKFHWDNETDRHAKEPTSCWVRVSQVFAGAGEGGVWHPRVGVEVIVDFDEGDPDRPIVVGRVYNGRNKPPGGAKTVSTFKTMSSPATGAFNELTFDDTAGKEQIKMHTPYNWSSHAGNDRSEKVDNNSDSKVGTDRGESTGSNRRTAVGGDNAEVVAGSESVTVGANQTVKVGGSQTVDATGAQVLNSSASQKITAPTQEIGATGKQSLKSANLAVSASSAATIDTPAFELNGSSVKINASEIVLSAGGAVIKINGGGVEVSGPLIKVSGGSVTITGDVVKVN
ncbi:type VI secretion system Vgr family protein [Sorangium sp. So ce362]|uniref:type VI secretion system Vgr family protein n=1 Tax=Sorangium sp. So ce362 TaxID=3133303 RepID=UPI003F648EE6